MSFLTLDNVAHYHFDKRSYTKILDNITFTVKEGEFVTVLGPNGSGKTTLLSLIGGNIKPTDGNIQFRDDKGEKHRATVGWVLEDDYLLSWKTVIDNIVVKRKSMKMDDARDLLKKTGLSSYCYDYPPHLPAGVRQSVAFLRALVSKPDIILLDEPFSKLDYQSKLKLQEMVCHLIRIHRNTAVLATHDIDEAIALSDRILVMDSANALIAKTFEVPLELRQELPVFARQHPKYQLLFDKVWQELNKVVSLQHDL